MSNPLMVKILYAGSLSKYHDIGILYRALRDMPDQVRAGVGLVLYGEVYESDRYHSAYQQLGRLRSWGHPVLYGSRISQDELCKVAARCDYYLIADHNVAYKKGIVTSKIWNYIEWVQAFDARIIACATADSEIAKIVRETDTGRVYEDGHDLALQKEILNLYGFRKALYENHFAAMDVV